MTEWAYKVTPTKASLGDTGDIALVQLFLCRPMNHLENGRPVRTGRVTDVAVGDTLHLYYLDGGKLRRTIGSFEVIAGRDHPRADQFVATRVGASVTVNENRLRRRRKGSSTTVPGGAGSASALVALLEDAGYERDLVDGTFVGWCLRKLNRLTPPYDRGWFPARAQAFIAPLPASVASEFGAPTLRGRRA